MESVLWRRVSSRKPPAQAQHWCAEQISLPAAWKESAVSNQKPAKPSHDRTEEPIAATLKSGEVTALKQTAPPWTARISPTTQTARCAGNFHSPVTAGAGRSGHSLHSPLSRRNRGNACNVRVPATQPRRRPRQGPASGLESGWG